MEVSWYIVILADKYDAFMHYDRVTWKHKYHEW